MDVIARLDRTRAARNVLEHPFYRRWSAGELSAGELGSYAGEYRHAVIALADASAKAAVEAAAAERAALARHAEEEAAHVALWDAFASAAGARAESLEDASAQTRSCVRAWTAGEELLERLAVLYVIEASQPEISRTKLDGLSEHYGYSAEGPACEYFRVHELRDREHAHEARELIELLISRHEDPDRCADRMVSRAAAALRGNWQLLDGVPSREVLAAG